MKLFTFSQTFSLFFFCSYQTFSLKAKDEELYLSKLKCPHCNTQDKQSFQVASLFLVETFLEDIFGCGSFLHVVISYLFHIFGKEEKTPFTEGGVA
jgi:hypothetical protein